MMTISLSEVGKRFNRDWIFRKFSYKFTSDHSYAITGPNGSGKSTLLQVIGGAIVMSEGEIRYEVLNTKVEQGKNRESRISVIAPDIAFKYISIAAPYLEVIEEMTAVEFLNFTENLNPFYQVVQFSKYFL